jgi:hypothetical protein
VSSTIDLKLDLSQLEETVVPRSHHTEERGIKKKVYLVKKDQIKMGSNSTLSKNGF